MHALAELDLPFLPMGTQAFADDPFPFIAEARLKHPWIARCEAGHCVFDYSAMNEIMRMDEHLRPGFDGVLEQMEAKDTPWGRFFSEQMIALPDAEHTFLRTTFAARFTPRFANQLRPMMVETITRLIDQWAPKGQIDFEEFASRFPISVMFGLVGAPLDAIEELHDDLEAIGLATSMQKERVPRINEGYVRLEAFVEKIIADRRAEPRTDGVEDLLTMLIEAGDSGNVAHRQLVDLINFFFIAGYDTSKNVLTFTMKTLLDYPEIYQRCAEDHDYCRKVIEEALRFFNPGTTFRVIGQELLYRDVLLPRGTMLFFPLSISGRDAVAFPDGQVFDPDRAVDPRKRHIAFGLGKHMCLGQYIARAQLQEALHQIARRMREPKLAGEYGMRPFYGTWGLKGLPITFTPA